MPFASAHPQTGRFWASRAIACCGLAFIVFLFGSTGLQNAVAEGDTRTISMHHIHTGENITITYKRDGRYDEAALEKINWFLRDWRRSKETSMDPELIDLLWDVQRETGSKQPIDIVCGYRSPETNAMLRRTSRGVARFSQHMLGHAVDFYIPGVALEQLREIGLRLQRGGVGFYPTSGSPFVHMDTGGVRMWPRMTRNELLRVFPDGRTVYLPSDGLPLPGYALAMADLRRRGQNPTETWFEEAHRQGLNKTIVLASNLVQHDDPDRAEDAREAAEDAKSPPANASANTLLAALELAAARRREAAGLAAPAPSDMGGALYQTASYTTPPAGQAPQETGLTPSQIVTARGSWDELPGAAAAPHDTNAVAAAASRRKIIASVVDATGAISRLPAALEDRVPADIALSYAEQGEPQTSSAGSAAPKARRIAQARAPQPLTDTTIAVERSANQIASTIVAAHPRIASAGREGTRFDNPWLEAVVVSPSVRLYFTALMLGEQDYRALAPLVHKPASVVMMTFAADPNPGLTSDRFSGSAVVFVSTVTYRPPTHTAFLQWLLKTEAPFLQGGARYVSTLRLRQAAD